MNVRPKALLSLFALISSACSIAPPTETPIASIPEEWNRGTAEALLVMLPGRGDRASTFVDAGFLDRDDNPLFDIVAVDAHFGYYMKRSLLPRLHDDIIQPAIDAGYQSVWLLGVSMGGLGSLLYASEHPDKIQGVILLAPYLGDAKLAAEVQAAGGLSSWNPDESGFKDHEVAVWAWLKESRAAQDPVPVILGFGRDDKFADSYAPLRVPLPELTVYEEAGSHNWATWHGLWRTIRADMQSSPETKKATQ